MSNDNPVPSTTKSRQKMSNFSRCTWGSLTQNTANESAYSKLSNLHLHRKSMLGHCGKVAGQEKNIKKCKQYRIEQKWCGIFATQSNCFIVLFVKSAVKTVKTWMTSRKNGTTRSTVSWKVSRLCKNLPKKIFHGDRPRSLCGVCSSAVAAGDHFVFMSACGKLPLWEILLRPFLLA